MEPDAGHLMNLGAASQFFFPVGRLGVNRTEREQQATAMLAALQGQTRVDGAKVLVQQAVQAARSGLRDTVAAELGDECRRVITRETADRPA